MVVRVGVIDDHRAMLVGVTAIIQSHPGFQVVAAGRSVAELLAAKERMDVILLDLTLSDGSTPAHNVAALIGAGAPVLVHASLEPLAVIRAAARAGAVGMVDKAGEAPRLMAALRAAVRGELPGGDWTASIARVPSAPVRIALSAREAEVFARYAVGATADSVAQALFITRETVLDHVRRIRGKYAAAGRPAATKVDLYRRAVEDGYIHPQQ
jgi:DNA-binding NarL/FixJ family response regulator